MKNSKVFVLGLDGATFELILPWASEGKLPAFSRLKAEGAWGELESVPNQRSAAAWTSFMTGKNPGKHGIFEFYEYLPSSNNVRFINSGHREGESLWKILSRENKEVGVINVPMTYPAEKVNGFLIAGLDSPSVRSKGFTYPSALYESIRREFGEYILEPGLTGAIAGGRVKEAVHLAETEMRQKIDVCRHLMKTRQWDFFMVVLRSLDAVQHCFWKYMDPTHPHFSTSEAALYGDTIFNTYKKIDSFLGDLMASLDEDTTLMIMSDHGFGQKHPATNQLNQWLEKKGFLSYTSLQGGDAKGLLAKIYKGVISKTPRKAKEWLWETFPAMRNRVQSRLCFSNIDWSKTLAYSDSLFPVVRVNLRGREVHGWVEQGEDYIDLVQRLVSELRDLRDMRTGEKIVDDVLLKEDLYHGTHVNKAPDLLVKWKENTIISGIRIESDGNALEPATPPIPGEDYRIISGDHHLKGVFMAKGKNIKNAEEVLNAHIIDLAPTILYLMGVPVPDDMDGKILETILDESFLRSHPVNYDRYASAKNKLSQVNEEYTTEEREEILARLKGLGYL